MEDLDGDGFVGIGDLDIVLGNWNTPIPKGDLAGNGDSFVGIDDLDVLLSNWNAGTLPPPPAAGSYPPHSPCSHSPHSQPCADIADNHPAHRSARSA